MRIVCPSCGVSGTADDSYSGKKIRCPKCDEVFRCLKDGEPLETTEEAEMLHSHDEEEKSEDVESSLSDRTATLTTEELLDLPCTSRGQVPDDDVVVEQCDYCSGGGRPGERLEIVDRKKACSDCLPLLTGTSGKTANGFQSITGDIPVTQGTRSGNEAPGKKSLVRSIVGRFKELFSR